MRQVSYVVATSLDGKIAGPDGDLGCFGMVGDEHVPDYLALLDHFDTVLMGRKTYEVGLAVEVTDPYPKMETFVFSTTLQQSSDSRVHIVSQATEEQVRKLKLSQGRDIYLCGGGELAATLLSAGLIDELVVKLNPLLIGGRLDVFAWIHEPVRLELLGTKVYGNGVVLLHYRVPEKNRSSEA